MSKLSKFLKLYDFLERNFSSDFQHTVEQLKDGNFKVNFKSMNWIDYVPDKHFPFIESTCEQDFNILGDYDSPVNIIDLKGSPEYVPGQMYIRNIDSLISLEGCPKEIGHDLIIRQCPNIASLKGIVQKIKMIALFRVNIKEIDDFPDISDQIVLADLPCLKSLRGLENKKTSSLSLTDLKIKNLDFVPQCEYVEIKSCDEIIDISGLNNKVEKSISYNDRYFCSFDEFDGWWKRNIRKR